MSPVPSARKNAESQIGRKTIEEYGVPMPGKNRKRSSLPKIHPVVRAVIQVKSRTIPDTTYTDGPNILISPIHVPTVPGVIEVSVGVDSSVSNVARLKQNKKVLSAIIALTNVIENALSTGKSTGNDLRIKATRRSEGNSKTNGKVHHD